MNIIEHFIEIVESNPGIGTNEIRRRLIRAGVKTRNGNFDFVAMHLCAERILIKTKKGNGFRWWPNRPMTE